MGGESAELYKIKSHLKAFLSNLGTHRQPAGLGAGRILISPEPSHQPRGVKKIPANSLECFCTLSTEGAGAQLHHTHPKQNKQGKSSRSPFPMGSTAQPLGLPGDRQLLSQCHPAATAPARAGITKAPPAAAPGV